MGCAEVISLSEVRASPQWQRLRNALHARFDQWLDRLEEQLPDPKTSLAAVTEAVWQLRQDLTGGLSETMIEQAHVGERTRQDASCSQSVVGACGRGLWSHAPARRWWARGTLRGLTFIARQDAVACILLMRR
jgi:hypothetical protein